MKGYVANIEKLALDNDNFRRVLFTTKNTQLVLMALQPGEDIGEEMHDVDQFLRVESSFGKVELDGVSQDLTNGSVVIVPAGTRHNLFNLGEGQMKLYTLYVPPHHKDGTVHKTKAEAAADSEHFDGQITNE